MCFVFMVLNFSMLYGSILMLEKQAASFRSRPRCIESFLLYGLITVAYPVLIIIGEVASLSGSLALTQSFAFAQPLATPLSGGVFAIALAYGLPFCAW